MARTTTTAITATTVAHRDKHDRAVFFVSTRHASEAAVELDGRHLSIGSGITYDSRVMVEWKVDIQIDIVIAWDVLSPIPTITVLLASPMRIDVVIGVVFRSHMEYFS